MKKIFLAVLVCVISISSFGRRMSPLSQLAGTWAIQQMVINNKLQSTAKDNNVLTLNAGGTLTANFDCNTINNSISTKGTNKLEIGMGISTKMACGGRKDVLENNYGKVIETVNNFTLKGNTLTLFKDKKKIMVLQKYVPKESKAINTKKMDTKKEEPVAIKVATIDYGTPLQGKWRVIQYNRNGTIIETKNGDKTRITFTDKNEQSFIFNAGCDPIDGRYFMDGGDNNLKMIFNSALNISSCAQKEVEADFYTILLKTTMAKVDGNHAYIYAGETMTIMLEKVTEEE